jgi:PKD repeat protein
VTLTLLPDPSAAFTADTSNCPNVVFTNQSTNATTFAWDFADGGTSSTQSPAHNYQSAGNGTYNVRLISTGGCGSDTAIVPVVINCLVGIADPHRVAITLYPNPSNGTFKVRLTGLQEEATLRIYDLGGKQLFRRHLDQRGDFEENVRLDAAAGMYFLKLSVGGQEITKRIVIE